MNPFQLDERELFILWTELPRIRALREFERRTSQAPLTPERVYSLEKLLSNEANAIEAENQFILLQARADQ